MPRVHSRHIVSPSASTSATGRTAPPGPNLHPEASRVATHTIAASPVIVTCTCVPTSASALASVKGSARRNVSSTGARN
jgi:hypothetical protein